MLQPERRSLTSSPLPKSPLPVRYQKQNNCFTTEKQLTELVLVTQTETTVVCGTRTRSYFQMTECRRQFSIQHSLRSPSSTSTLHGLKLGPFRDSGGQENKNQLQKRVFRQKPTLVASWWCKANLQRPHELDISPCAKAPRSGSSTPLQSTFLDDRTL